ncbi:hypothetical protein Bbelb_271030 [Branchiostoma belcheri]|nr:hypothetical protein Bbelb_271030 [Branchiostoma belcheri]
MYTHINTRYRYCLAVLVAAQRPNRCQHSQPGPGAPAHRPRYPPHPTVPSPAASSVSERTRPRRLQTHGPLTGRLDPTGPSPAAPSVSARIRPRRLQTHGPLTGRLDPTGPSPAAPSVSARIRPRRLQTHGPLTGRLDPTGPSPAALSVSARIRPRRLHTSLDARPKAHWTQNISLHTEIFCVQCALGLASRLTPYTRPANRPAGSHRALSSCSLGLRTHPAPPTPHTRPANRPAGSHRALSSCSLGLRTHPAPPTPNTRPANRPAGSHRALSSCSLGLHTHPAPPTPNTRPANRPARSHRALSSCSLGLRTHPAPPTPNTRPANRPAGSHRALSSCSLGLRTHQAPPTPYTRPVNRPAGRTPNRRFRVGLPNQICVLVKKGASFPQKLQKCRLQTVHPAQTVTKNQPLKVWKPRVLFTTETFSKLSFPIAQGWETSVVNRPGLSHFVSRSLYPSSDFTPTQELPRRKTVKLAPLLGRVSTWPCVFKELGYLRLIEPKVAPSLTRL